MKPLRKILLMTAAGAALAIGPVAATALTQAKPSAPNGATRIRNFAINLDGSRGSEHILVFNRNQSGQPTTYLSVWHQRGDRRWDQTQYSRVFGPSPGSQASGLEYAVAGELNGDNRVEVAVLDFVTPSVGEVLSILRQSRYHGLRFKPLQTISGDRILRAPSAPGSAIVFAVTITANHSPDGTAHNERWAWSKSKQRWTCISGPMVCVPR